MSAAGGGSTGGVRRACRRSQAWGDRRFCPSIFDRLAGHISTFTAKPWLFTICVLVVVVWAQSLVVLRSVDTWQLIINTATTIITFLLVALQARGLREAVGLEHRESA